jgi:hypothetical protein
VKYPNHSIEKADEGEMPVVPKNGCIAAADIPATERERS